MAFGLSTSDLDGILKTLNRVVVDEHERSWKLKHDDVEEFGKRYGITFLKFSIKYILTFSLHYGTFVNTVDDC